MPNWELLAGLQDQVVAGVDEVGRGAWAGPVVAAAVVLPAGRQLAGLADSKLLPPVMRQRLDRIIRRQAVAVGLGWVAAAEVDAHGLTWAVRESGQRALTALGLAFDLVILDGKHNYLEGLLPARTFVKADALITPVAAASVVAKVARDRHLRQLASQHRGYGFGQHKGYGTPAHAAALRRLGPSAEHRLSYAPLRALQAAADLREDLHATS